MRLHTLEQGGSACGVGSEIQAGTRPGNHRTEESPGPRIFAGVTLAALFFAFLMLVSEFNPKPSEAMSAVLSCRDRNHRCCRQAMRRQSFGPRAGVAASPLRQGRPGLPLPFSFLAQTFQPQTFGSALAR